MSGSRSSINRRDLFQAAMTAGAVSMLNRESARGETRPEEATETGRQEGDSPERKIVDTNVHLSQWPFRRLPLDSVDSLVNKLNELGIARAWAGSFDALLHRDMAAVNQRLVDACRQHPELVPIGAIDPTLPDWQSDFRQCVDAHGMPALRVYPNYHGYRLDQSCFGELLAMATTVQRPVQIVAAMEDTRTQHPAVQVEDVDLSALPAVMRQHPGARVQILNARLRGSVLLQLAQHPAIFFDTARVEGTDGVASLLDVVSAERVMYGSHAPFLIPEAALIRVHESDLDEDKLRLLLADNARGIVRGRNG